MQFAGISEGYHAVHCTRAAAPDFCRKRPRAITSAWRHLSRRWSALTLEVLHVDERARVLYERLGFRVVVRTETHESMTWDGAHPTGGRDRGD